VGAVRPGGPELSVMNAAAALIRSLDRAALVHLATKVGDRSPSAESALVVARLSRRFDLDLVGLLNALDRGSLVDACTAWSESTEGDVGALRARLWRRGAILEAGGDSHLGQGYQPVPVVLRRRLRRLAPVRGQMPPAAGWPRPVPL